MKLKVSYLVFLYCIGLVSCGGNSKSFHDFRYLHNGKVVVVFEDSPIQTSTSRIGNHLSTSASTISFVDTNGDLVIFEPRLLGRDTLEIPTYRGYAELCHLYQVVERDCFLLQEGDTVLVKYDATGRPILSSLVYKSNTPIYNLPYALPHAIQHKGYYIGTVLSDPYFQKSYSYFTDSLVRARYPGIEEYNRPAYVDLDSVSVIYGQYQAKFKSTIDSLFRDQIIDEVNYRYLSRHFLNESFHMPEVVVQSDSLLHYVSNYYIARNYRDVNLSANKRTKAFDVIVNDTVVTPLARKGILKYLLNEILTDEGGWHHYPKDIKNRYVQKYSEITGDSLVVQQILQNATDVASLKSVLPLETPEGQKISLEKILAKNKGNVVYVDFWASWCAPCLGQLPYSEALHKRLTGQNIEFLYISVDTNRKAWLDKVREHSDMLADSYRILDTDVDFLKQIKLDKIPRYLIYDRNGILVDQDAPRPSDEEIERRIMTFLNEKKTRP